MIKHMIVWKLKNELTDTEKTKIKKNAKKALEALYGEIPGIRYIKVRVEGLESSNADMMLDSAFEDENALEVYQKHPHHQAAANTYVRPFVETRMCFDFIE